VGVSDQGVLVQKYGRRSHFTTGKILHVYTAANGANTIDMCTLPGLGETGHRYKIIGTAPSAFADGTPATAGGVTNPQNEPGFYNTNVKAGVIAQIVQLTNPLTNARFTNVEAETAFASLKAQNHIGPLFSAPGDSGSWIYKADGKVLGLYSKGHWEMDFSSTVTVDMGGSQTVPGFPYIRRFALAFDINEAVSHANTLLNGPRVSVCVEAQRPMPTTQNDCTYVSDMKCTFPHACIGGVHKGIAGCTKRKMD